MLVSSRIANKVDGATDHKSSVHVLANGDTSPWLCCKGCGAETYYRPSCGSCHRDLLRDIIEDCVSADAAGAFDPGVLLSDVIFKGKPKPSVTTELPPVSYRPPLTLEEMMSGGPSIAGWSVSSGAMGCPRYAQLYADGVQSVHRWALGEELNHLGYGLLMHALLAVRWVYGMEWALQLLGSYQGLHPLDYQKAFAALKIYDEQWPRHLEPWYVLGIETEVITEILPGLVLSVRYDMVVKPFKRDPNGGLLLGDQRYAVDAGGMPIPEDHVLSIERKTTSQGGESTMASYTGQFYTQAANWNANKVLVERYGPMVGIIGDLVTKTKVPRADRIGPKYITKHQQQFALEYHRYKAQIRWPVNERGELPRMLHNCIGRYGPCPYFALCHDDAVNLYETKAQALARRESERDA